MYKKFEYKKWVTENKFGLLLEQTGSGTGSGNPSTGSGNPSTGSGNPSTGSGMQVCYGCVNNQTVNSGGIQFNVQSNGYCGTMSNQGVTTTYYYPQTHSQLANCGIPPSTGSGTGSSGPSTGGPTPTGSGCDNTPNSQCAQTWLHSSFVNNPSWTNFMSNKACTGTHTYIGVMNNLLPQIGTLWANKPNANVAWTQPNNYMDIHQMAVAGFGTGPAGAAAGRGQFKRKMAKMTWAWCMNSCCTTIPENKKK